MHEKTSARAARFLTEHGVSAVALTGGYEAWVAEGRPTEPKDS